MQIHAIHLRTGKQTILKLRNRRTTLALDPSGSLQQHRSKYALSVQFDGYNFIVTDLGSPTSASIGNQPLSLNAPRIWLENQTLQLGENYLLTWELPKRIHLKKATDSRNHPFNAVPLSPTMGMGLWARLRALPTYLPTLLRLRFATPFERVAPGLTALLFVLLFAGIGTFMWRYLGTLRGVVASVPTATATNTPSPTETSTATPTVVRTPKPSPLPLTPTVVRIDEQQDRAPVTQEATQTQQALLTVEVQARGTATPVPCVTPTPLLAGKRPDHALKPMDVQVDPACVQPGKQFWHLVTARWLGPTELAGFHHVFVDVIDEQGARIVQPPAKFVMSWPTGSCKRTISGRSAPFDHGEHCPMYASGRIYDVHVEGLPSDVVRGLGLGSSAQRDWAILGSYQLIFQRTILN